MKTRSAQTLLKVAQQFKPPPTMTVSEWAATHRRLSVEGSGESGRWRNDRAPYQVGIMDAICDPSIEQVVVMSSAQVGKTEFILNMVGSLIHLNPCPMLMVQPTIEMAQSWSKERLAPMIRDTPVLKGKVKDPRSRDSGNTLRHKSFPGGYIAISGANSPASLASRPVRVVLFDEVDRFDSSAGAEGDPIELAIKRTRTFLNRKIVMVSTPTIKGVSRIEKAWLQSDQRKYHVDCPHCGAPQPLEWKGVTFDYDKETKKIHHTHYTCQDNGCVIEENERHKLVGDWVKHGETGKIAGFHINELSSPWSTWKEVSQKFLEVKDDKEQLKVFINTTLGEPFDDEGEVVEWERLYDRREHFPEKTPKGVLVITAGVDTQDNRFEVVIKGWGLGFENWALEYEVIQGDPNDDETKAKLASYLYHTSFETEDGRILQLEGIAIDTGGHRDDAVYNLIREYPTLPFFAVKGASKYHAPFAQKAKDSKEPGILLYLVGSSRAKEQIMDMLRTEEHGPKFSHFPESCGEEYFRQLTSEKRVGIDRGGYTVGHKWISIYRHHEVLDCTVYAYICLHIIGYGLQKDLEDLAKAIKERGSEEKIKPPSQQYNPHLGHIDRNWLNR